MWENLASFTATLYLFTLLMMRLREFSMENNSRLV